MFFDTLLKPVLGGTTTNRTPFRFCHPSHRGRGIKDWRLENLIWMEDIVVNIQNSALVSAWAAFISACFAGLAFLSSRRLSTREKIDILKAEILRVISTAHDRADWIATGTVSRYTKGGGIGPDVRSLAGFLGTKYKRKKWIVLIPTAIEELRNEGYRKLLGI